MRDVLLLTGPDVNSVPMQVKRVWLMENGYVISGFQLQQEWSECVVEAFLRGYFALKKKNLWSLSYEVIFLARFSRSRLAGNVNTTNFFKQSYVDRLFLKNSVNH